MRGQPELRVLQEIQAQLGPQVLQGKVVLVPQGQLEPLVTLVQLELQALQDRDPLVQRVQLVTLEQRALQVQ